MKIFTSPNPKLDQIPKDTNIYDAIFGNRAKSAPDNSIALADEKERISYKQLHDLTTRIGAGWLKKAGLKPGDVVLMNIPTCPQFFVLFLCLQAAGLLVSLANPAYGPAEFKHAVELVQAKVVVTADSLVSQTLSAGVSRSQIVLFGPKSKENDSLPEFRELALQSFEEAQKVLKDSGASSLTSDKFAAICFSSGTTGLPKGVVLKHLNIIAESDSLTLNPGFRNGPENVVNSLPCFHIAGLASTLHALIERDNVHFAMKAPFDIVFVAKKMQEVQAGRVLFVPPILLGLIRHPVTKAMKFPHLRNITCGAAPLGPDLHKEAHELLKIPIIQVWGLSETTGAVTVTSPSNKDAPYGSAGKVISGTELRLVDVESGKDVGEDTPGEVWVKAPVNFACYYRNEKATRETFEGEWFKTGDIGVMKKSGDLFIVDRLKELLKYKGMQIAPAELEDVLLSHPKVGDAAVVGIRDSNGNDLARAYIVASPGLQISEEELKEEVRAYVASKLAHFKHLRGGVTIIKEIPKNPSGKILRRLLRDEANKEAKSKL